MGLAGERRCTNDHRVLNRAHWSARQGSRMLWGVLITLLGPAEATIVLGADDTVARRHGRPITAKGGDREAVRSSKSHGLRCVGLTWVSMRLVVPVPWRRRGWAWPLLSGRCWPAAKSQPRRHQTSVDGVRHMVTQGRRWRPGRRLVLVGDGGLAAVSLALAGVKHHVGMVSRLRWEAALYPPPGPHPQGKRGPTPVQGKRQRRVQAWASHSDTPWETVAVAGYGGQRQQWWVFSRPALWYTPGLPPVDIRDVLVGDPEGKLRMAAFFCPDPQATPVPILPWVVRR